MRPILDPKTTPREPGPSKTSNANRKVLIFEIPVHGFKQDAPCLVEFLTSVLESEVSFYAF